MLAVYAWLAAALIFLIFEMGHPGLFYWLSFALGSIVAAGLAWYEFSWHIVLLAFLAGSFAAIALLKATVGKILARHDVNTKTNVDALIGKQGLVVKAISKDEPGRVKVGGELWLARAQHGVTLVEGTRVHVIIVRGSHVVVAEISE